MTVPSALDLINGHWVEGISLGIGVLGTLFGAYGIYQTRKYRRLSQTITWEDLNIGCKNIIHKIRKELGKNWKPDIILASSPRGGIVAEILAEPYFSNVPRLVGFCLNRERGTSKPEFQGYASLETPKWYIFIPTDVISDKYSNVLIVDNAVMTGSVMREIENYIRQKAPNARVFSASIITSSVAALNSATNFSWKVRDDMEFFWPWGIAR